MGVVMDSGRGKAWVIVQFILLAAIGLAPAVNNAPTLLSVVIGFIIGGIGTVFGTVGQGALGKNMTVHPRPRPDSVLVQTGPYSLVRHPIYTGGILALLGWSIIWGSILGIVLTVVLAVFFDRKAALEETYLEAQFTEYPSYRQRVRKLIPWIY
jgi:protein-S-isoprenylcysteine O-methyltransferase Ste14